MSLPRNWGRTDYAIQRSIWMRSTEGTIIRLFSPGMEIEHMEKNSGRWGVWINLFALLLSLFSIIVSAGGALSTYFYQLGIPEAPLWPLPGLVLSYWIVLGIASFMLIGVTSFSLSPRWLRAAWGITGAYIPLAIIGAFSIGTLVLIASFLSLISTLLLSVRIRLNWLKCFNFFWLGAICSLLVVLLIVSLGKGS